MHSLSELLQFGCKKAIVIINAIKETFCKSAQKIKTQDLQRLSQKSFFSNSRPRKYPKNKRNTQNTEAQTGTYSKVGIIQSERVA